MSLFAGSAAFAYETIEVKNGGEITGTVKVTGKTTAPAPVRVYKNREVCGAHVENESLVVGPGNGLRYAVVTLVDITKGKAVEMEAVNALDNARCAFVPHVQAVSVGQWIELKNTDPILHNADAVLDKGQTLFNVGLWPGRELRRPVAYPGVIRINCDVHPWMSAYVIATDHPYHAVTDLYGAYEIDDVPPGTYQIRVWHETLGTQQKQVQVKPGGKTEVDFALSAETKVTAPAAAQPPQAQATAPPQPPAAAREVQPRTGQAEVRPALSAKGVGEVTGSVTIRGKVEPGVKDAVVWVEGVPHELISKESLKPDRTATMDQKNLAFAPRVLPVLVGTTVNFPNDDPVFHDVYSASPVHKFDLGLYPQGRSRSTEFDQPGIAQIGCNVHAQMNAYVVVLAEPFFTKPNERGVYQLGDVPLGTYTIKVWHPDFAAISQPFTLEREGQVLNLDFDLGKEK